MKKKGIVKKPEKMNIAVSRRIWRLVKQEALDRDINMIDVIEQIIENRLG